MVSFREFSGAKSGSYSRRMPRNELRGIGDGSKIALAVVKWAGPRVVATRSSSGTPAEGGAVGTGGELEARMARGAVKGASWGAMNAQKDSCCMVRN